MNLEVEVIYQSNQGWAIAPYSPHKEVSGGQLQPFVRNLSYGVIEPELRRLADRYGAVKVMRDDRYY